MNHCIFTGWLPQEADRRRTPGPNGHEVVTFRLMVKDGRGEEQQLFFRCDDAAIVARCADVLTRGRTVIVHAEARRMEVHKFGGVAGDYTGFVVLGCEVPNRSKPVDGQDSPTVARSDARTEPAEVAR